MLRQVIIIISAAEKKSKTSWNIIRKEMGKLGSDKKHFNST